MSLRRFAPLLLLVACGDAADGLRVERTTVGDTTIVRTLAGSEWGAPARLEPEVRIGTLEGEDEYMLGEVTGLAVAPDGSMYVYDAQVPALRKYSADGRFVATLGREGGGPGEYKQSDGGLVVLPDGRVVLRDPGNARLNVYAPTGESLGQWPFRGGSFTSRPMFWDTAGNVYAQIWSRRGEDRYNALLRFTLEGEPADSLAVPTWDHETPYVRYAAEGMSMAYGVPFAPSASWTFSPHGYFVGGLSTRYAVDLLRPADVLRVERVVEPIPVTDAEKADAEARILAIFRRYDPSWKWNGPAIPSTKPPFRALRAGRDGRIWVQLSQSAEPVPGADEPTAPGEVPEPRWREPIVYDVFDPDAVYLGQVTTPAGFSAFPEPIFDRDRVWAIVNDELGVDYLTRFRIVRAGSEGR